MSASGALAGTLRCHIARHKLPKRPCLWQRDLGMRSILRVITRLQMATPPESALGTDKGKPVRKAGAQSYRSKGVTA